VCENRVLRTFGPKREVAGGWRRLHNEEFHNLYALLIIIRMIEIKEDEIDGACSTYGRGEKCVENFGRKIWKEQATRRLRRG
jgi:hypothetical protein